MSDFVAPQPVPEPAKPGTASITRDEIADFIREEWGADGTFTMRNDLLRKLAARFGIAEEE